MTETDSLAWILFDAVGTLIRPAPSVARVYWEIGQRYGSRLTEKQVKHQFQREFSNSYAGSDARDLVSSERIERDRWRQIVSQVLHDVQDFERCFAEVHDHFAAPGAWRLFEDVPDAVAHLRRAGFRLAIASNFDDRLHSVARGHQVLTQFQHVFTSAELGFRKPSLRFYEELARRLNTSSEKMVMVGDDLQNDVESARAAGLRAVLIDRENRKANSTGRIANLMQLRERIGL